MNHAPPILLTIAGFDPSCGAGVAADLKTFAAHNCYGVAAITALTVQSTQGVKSVHPTPAAQLRAQLDELAGRRDDRRRKNRNARESRQCRGGDGISRQAQIRARGARSGVPPDGRERRVARYRGLKFVRDELLKRVSVITPNIPEAEFLTGIEVKDLSGMKAAGAEIDRDGRARGGRHRRAS